MTFVALLLLASQLLSMCVSLPVCDPKPGTPPNAPFGTSKGICPGRVSWFYDGSACSWDGATGYYWDAEHLDQNRVDKMLGGVLLSVTGLKSNLSNAWDSLFRHFNEEHFGKDLGYQAGQTITVKANLNAVVSYDQRANYNSVTPQFLVSLLRQLTQFAGVPQKNIRLIDPSRFFPSYCYDKPVGIGTEFPDVVVIDNAGGQPYSQKAIPDSEAKHKIRFSDTSIHGWNTTLLPQSVVEADYIIQVDAFRGHTLAGFTETGKNWFGAVYQPDIPCEQFGKSNAWCPSFLHGWVNITGSTLPARLPGQRMPARPMGVYNPLVDLIGHDDLSAKGLLFLSDGTYSGISQSNMPPIWYDMAPMSGGWSCSVFASMDPMALDSVLFDFLLNEPTQPFPKKGCGDNYLHEGAMAADPPSGTVYAPSGHRLESLGVHEHWNNAIAKEYSRNLGTGEGIELIKVHET